jgi:hypothetical protein
MNPSRLLWYGPPDGRQRRHLSWQLPFLDMKDGINDDIRDRDLATFEDHMVEDYLIAINQWHLRATS